MTKVMTSVKTVNALQIILQQMTFSNFVAAISFD